MDTDDKASVFMAVIILLAAFLFAGTPDIHDAILYRIADMPLPVVEN